MGSSDEILEGMEKKGGAAFDDEDPHDQPQPQQQQPEIKYRGITTMPFIIGNEIFEKLGTVGTASNLVVYFTVVFQMKAIAATNLVNLFNGTSNFATIFGAFLSDTYFGRYYTLALASLASLLGMTTITLTAAIRSLHPPPCSQSAANADDCDGPTPWQMAFLIGGLGFLVIGAGGIRPCNLAFGADQFNPNTESGKRGIDSFFNWYFFTYTFSVMISLTAIVYVQSDISWAWGFAIPAFCMFFSCFFFFIGTRIYVRVKPFGNPLTSVVKVVVVTFKKRKLKLPEQPIASLFNYVSTNSINSKLGHSKQFRFLDKAAIITPEDQINHDGSAAHPWRLCSIQQVEELKCILRIIPIWSTSIIYYVPMVHQTYGVFQALQSDRRLGPSGFKIPAASFYIFTMIGVTIWVPMYDRILVPALRKLTGKDSGITLLQKMSVGLALNIATLFLSAFVESRRRHLALEKPIGIEFGRGAISSMSGLWLIPQFILIGISEAFTSISYIEFYYKQVPENMRSIGGSFLFVGHAMSSYLGSLLISVVHEKTKESSANGDWLAEDLNQGKLDNFYSLDAALQVLNLIYFLVCAKWYRYKEFGSKDLDVSNP